MKFISTLIALALISTHSLANDLAEAMSYYEQRDYSNAVEKLEKIRSNEAETLFPLAVSQFRTGEYKAADKTVEKLISLSPTDGDAYYLKGLIQMGLLNEVSMFRKLGVAKAALAAWEKSVEVQPDHVTGAYAVFSFLVNAPGMAGGDLERAKTMLPEIMALSPTYGEMAKGVLAAKEEKAEVALAHFVKATSTAGEDAGPWFGAAQFYVQNNEPAKALEALAQYRQLPKRWNDPVDANVLLLQGRALALQGNKGEARNSLEQALSLAGNDRTRDFIEDELDKL